MAELDTIRSSLLAPVHQAGRSFSGRLSPSQVILTGICVASAKTSSYASVSYMKNDRWVSRGAEVVNRDAEGDAELVADASSQVKWSTMTVYTDLIGWMPGAYSTGLCSDPRIPLMFRTLAMPTLFKIEFWKRSLLKRRFVYCLCENGCSVGSW